MIGDAIAQFLHPNHVLPKHVLLSFLPNPKPEQFYHRHKKQTWCHLVRTITRELLGHHGYQDSKLVQYSNFRKRTK